MQIEFMGGCHIDEAARQLVAAAIEHGEATGSFNDIELKASPESKPEQIVSDWNARQAAAAEAYRNSHAGKKAAKGREDRRSAAQQEHDNLMKLLPNLNMLDDVAVLTWLCSMQDPSDHNGVIVRRDTIVGAFEKAGYAAGANCGKDYRKGDRENMFRYLVGQALSGLKDGPAIHPILHRFVADWKAEFGLCARK